MRILQLIEFFTPKMGGSPRVAYHTAKQLAARGHDVTVCSSNYGVNEAAFPDGGFDRILFPCIFARANFYVTPGLISWAIRHLRNFDVIHMHSLRTFQNMTVSTLAQIHGIPYVISPHGSLPLLNSRESLKKLYDLVAGSRLIQGAHSLIAVSEVEQAQFLDAGIARSKIRLLPNCIDLGEYRELPRRGKFRQRLGIEKETPLILFLGRLHPIKGLDILISAFALLASELMEVHLVIAGPDDGDLARLKRLANEAGVTRRIHFPGPVYEAEKLTAYVDADVVVVPGSYEIFGLVPFEALLCGTRVVAAKESAAGQILSQAGAARLFPSGQPDDLASAISQQLRQEDNSVALGQVFIRRRLACSQVALELENLYHEAVCAKIQPAVGVQ